MGGTQSSASMAASAAVGGGLVLGLLWRQGAKSKRRQREAPDSSVWTPPVVQAADTRGGGRKPESGTEAAAARPARTEAGAAEGSCGGKGRADVWEEECEDRYSAAGGREVSEFEVKLILKNDTKPVPEFWANKYEKEARRMWDKFYHQSENKFFKDRHYIHHEWGDLLRGDNIKVLDAGCGVGNTILPLLKLNPTMRVWACDFSDNAVALMLKDPGFEPARCTGWVADITKDALSEHTGAGEMEYAVLIFVLSAIDPSLFVPTLRNIGASLKVGGDVLFRDYGLYDMAQLKMAEPGKHMLKDRFYVRGDGTRAYFFDEEGLEGVFREAGFEAVKVGMHRRAVNNRKDGTVMHRRWVQGRFRKVA